MADEPITLNLYGKEPNQAEKFRTVQALEDAGEEQDVSAQGELGLTGLVGDITNKFERAKVERLPHEQRWLRQYHNYRGLYGADTQFRDSEQSRAFVKITKTKVLAAFGQILEILFQGNKFPLAVEPTEQPDGISEYAHSEPGNPNAQNEFNSDQEEESPYGYEGDGKELPPGATLQDILGGLTEKFEGAQLVPGPAPDATKMPQIEPAKIAASNMEKAILDQIDETDGHIALRKTILEMCMLGHGVIKGPFSIEKTIHDWKKNEETDKMEYTPLHVKMPGISWVSVWNSFPDPDAKSMKDAEWHIERHRMSRSQLRELGKRPFFRKDAIGRVLDNSPNYVDQWWEYKLRDAPVNVSRARYEVLEYWGVIDAKLVESTGLDIGLELDTLDEVQVNVWLCNHEILRCVLNPFTPACIPYHASPYEEHEYQFWGVGVAENMEDSQEIMNAFARLAIDNAAIASNLVFDIDETSLVPGQDMKVYPGKIFRRQAGQPGQAVFGLKFPNTFTDAMNVFDRFRQIADESTGLPSYSHGQTGVTSTTRTSSGLSMLMGAAALNIKGVVKNIDDFILQPLGEGFFHWNMQFNEDDAIRGDLCIKARGTSGLMAKEIKSQRLMQFLQIGAGNPALAPFTNFEHIMRELAISLDLDPDEVTNDPTMAALYAQIIGAAGGMGGGTGSPPGMDQSGVGGGNIGQGNVPVPGENGFTGNTPATSPNAGTGAESANASS
jgi:hypothetical protein